MVLVSVPVALLSIAGLSAYFAADWQRALTLGLYPKGASQLPRWLACLGRALHKWRATGAAWARAARGRPSAAVSGSSLRRHEALQERCSAFDELAQASPEAAPLVYHWALMTAVALLAMHVNVATRFLSACPALYWAAGGVAARGGAWARLLWLWCFVYIVLGCLLFPNFYPWT